MKITMLCLCGLYMPGWGYQENYLVKECVKAGYEVTVLTNSLTMDKKTQKYVPIDSGEFVQDGYKIIRLKMKQYGPFSNKIRKFVGLREHLNKAVPDILFVHGLQFGDLKVVKQVALANENCYVVGDTHADFGNSGMNFLSRNFLHKLYYKNLIQSALPIFHKIYYIAMETKEFLEKVYGVKKNTEMLSLGGKCYDDRTYETLREKSRHELKITEQQLIFLHSGKMNKDKKTIETLKAFILTDDQRFRLFIVGAISDDIHEEALQLINSDSRIKFLGWKSAAEMDELFCGSDFVIQIGTPSSTFQQAMCQRCILVLQARENSRFLLGEDRGFTVNAQNELSEFFEKLSKNAFDLPLMKEKVKNFARNELDYGVQLQKLVREYQAFNKSCKG